MKQLLEALAEWDGRSTAHLTDIHQIHKHRPDYPDRLLKLAREPGLQKAATWLVKHSLENHARYNAAQAVAFHGLPPLLESWEAKLHFLQSVPFAPPPPDAAKALSGFLEIWITHENKMVRAWSYNGFHLLGCRYPEYRKRAAAILQEARIRDKAPSVQARLRAITKKGFPGQATTA